MQRDALSLSHTHTQTHTFTYTISPTPHTLSYTPTICLSHTLTHTSFLLQFVLTHPLSLSHNFFSHIQDLFDESLLENFPRVDLSEMYERLRTVLSWMHQVSVSDSVTMMYFIAIAVLFYTVLYCFVM